MSRRCHPQASSGSRAGDEAEAPPKAAPPALGAVGGSRAARAASDENKFVNNEPVWAAGARARQHVKYQGQGRGGGQGPWDKCGGGERGGGVEEGRGKG